MPGIFDFLEGALGRPDPRQQIYAALGQGPGQPGGPAGPAPAQGAAGPGAAPPGPAGGAGGPAAAGGGAGGPGGVQINAMQGPTPSAVQSPPDLAQMYMQLAQRQQAEEGFNRGLGLLAASAYPGRRPDLIMKAMTGMTQDPGAMMGNLMQLQQFQIQQQNLNAFRQGLPKMLSDAGLSPDYAPLVQANPGLLGDILKARMGVTGDPAERALQAARNDWLMRNPGKTDSDMLQEHPEYSDPISFAATRTGQATTASSIAKEQADDRNAAQKSLPALQQSTGDMLRNLDTIIYADPNDLGKFVGGPVAANRPLTGAAVDLPGIGGNAQLGAAIDQATRQTFGEGFREVAGKTSRVTNTEATSLSGSLSQLQTGRALTPQQFQDQARIVKDRILHTLGTAYGEAGLSDQLPDYLKGSSPLTGLPYLDSEYAPPTDKTAAGSRYWKSKGSTPPGAYPGLASAAPGAAAAAPGGGAAAAPALKPMPDATKQAARDLIAKDPSQRGPLMDHLRGQGIDPTGL